MALIHIKADGTFEAVANRRTYASEIKGLKDAVASLKRIKADTKKKLSPLKRVAALKLQLQSARHARAVAIKKQIDDLRHKHLLSPKATIRGTEATIKKIERKLESIQKRIVRLTEADAKQKEKLKNKPAKVAPKTKLDGMKLDGSKPRRAVTRKVSFDTEARRATNDTIRGIKGKLRELDAQSRLPAKKKPAKSTTKHPGSVKTGAKATVLATIKQLKADIAKGLTGPKLARAQAELKKQRAALRQLRKGESAANQAAKTPAPKAKKAGMGSTESPRVAKLREQLKPLKPGSPEYRQIMTKIKTLQGRSPTGGNR